MKKKKEAEQSLVITSNDEIINSMSLEEITSLLDESQTSFIEDLYLKIEDREFNTLLIE